MRRVSTIVAIVLAFALFPFVSAAQEVTGKVQTVDRAARTFVVEGGIKITVPQVMPMDDVKEGAVVKVAFEDLAGMNIASRLEVIESERR